MKKTVFILFLILLGMAGCIPEHGPTYQATPYDLSQPSYFPTKNNIPADNPMTEEGVALGRKLFYDTRLSGRDGTDGIRSCSSCHHQENSLQVLKAIQ